MTARILWLMCIAGCIGGLRAGAAGVIYSNDFENGAGKEWSSDKVEATPREGRRFLGPFTTDDVTLRLEKLPKHKYVRVSLDLFILGTWDGNATAGQDGARIGPDSWRMQIEGGQTLVDATFSNLVSGADRAPKAGRTQSYPSVLPGENFPAKTGAAESNSLSADPNNGGNGLPDAVYKLSFVVPHEAGQMVIHFRGSEFLSGDGDETWGIDNVKVTALEEGDVAKMNEAEMRRLWEAIGGHDPIAENAAFWKLVEAGDDAARFLREKVKRGGVDVERFKALVKQLDDDNHEVREKATEAIVQMGPGVQGMLKEAIEKADSIEVKIRLRSALDNLQGNPPPDPEMRRHAIAVTLLRMIGTPEATKAAEELGG